MKLTERGIADTHAWKGYALPKFDRAKMIAATKKNPTWIHFGAGNIFRAFQAMLAQELLEKKSYRYGNHRCRRFRFGHYR